MNLFQKKFVNTAKSCRLMECQNLAVKSTYCWDLRSPTRCEWWRKGTAIIRLASWPVICNKQPWLLWSSFCYTSTCPGRSQFNSTLPVSCAVIVRTSWNAAVETPECSAVTQLAYRLYTTSCHCPQLARWTAANALQTTATWNCGKVAARRRCSRRRRYVPNAIWHRPMSSRCDDQVCSAVCGAPSQGPAAVWRLPFHYLSYDTSRLSVITERSYIYHSSRLVSAHLTSLHLNWVRREATQLAAAATRLRCLVWLVIAASN